MSKLTPEGEKIVSALAERYAIGADAVRMMLDAVAQGGGTMAQFNLPEFGGSGQWMRGGMTMVGDMFNSSMKATVDSLCNELSNLLATQVSLFAPVPFMPSQTQSQSQGNSPEVVSSWQSSHGAWWPTDLGYPAATGAQNNSRYAYFPNIRRLAVDSGGRVEVYDTTGYNIGGFAQQQGAEGSLTFTSQRGVVRVDSLPRETFRKAAQEPYAFQPAPASAPAPSGGDSASILGLIEQLATLKEKGVLTDAEFAEKKAELLKRL
jgi:hypothetical protein